MPLLKRGPEIFPQALFDLPDGESPWFVAHTRSRQEKALARYLAPLEIPFYLPSSENRVRRGGRNFVSYLPLFPGYVFLRGSAAERAAAVRSNLIVRLLDVPDQGLLHGELRDLRRLQVSGATLVPAPALFPGDAVRVTDGPFRGYTGHRGERAGTASADRLDLDAAPVRCGRVRPGQSVPGRPVFQNRREHGRRLGTAVPRTNNGDSLVRCVHRRGRSPPGE